MMIHRYSKIMHICSQVEGDSTTPATPSAVLPARTLSGAPRSRLRNLEQESDAYTAAHSAIWISPATMDTCIAIHMAAKKNGIVTVQAGGLASSRIPCRTNEYRAQTRQRQS